jgi:hypothetical protein
MSMNRRPDKVGADLLKQLRRAFSGLNRRRLMKLREAFRLVGDCVRVPYEGFPIELVLGEGGKRLHLYPDEPLMAEEQDAGPPDFLLLDPDHGDAPRVGFVRLEPGQRLTLGRKDALQQALFNYPEGVALRHLRLTHDDDAVVFEDKTTVGTRLSPILNERRAERMVSLRRVREIFGGPLEPLPREEALALLQAVTLVMQQEAFRPRDSRGLPGGLLQLPGELTPILLADLHARVDNLLVILTHDGVLRALEEDRACLVILGDAVHSERHGELEQMEESMLMMDLIFRLKLRFPRNLFFVRGNHDSFGEEISKGGVPQGLLWQRTLKEARGKEYRKAMQRYYDLLPYVAVSPDFIGTHAAPPRTKISSDMLVEIHRYPGLIPELISNRMQKPSRPGGYTKGDIRRFRKALGVPPDTPFIVGHTPMDRVETYWLNVAGAEDHHVLYSASEDWVGAFTRIDGVMWPLKLRAESLLPLINSSAVSRRRPARQRAAHP